MAAALGSRFASDLCHGQAGGGNRGDMTLLSWVDTVTQVQVSPSITSHLPSPSLPSCPLAWPPSPRSLAPPGSGWDQHQHQHWGTLRARRDCDDHTLPLEALCSRRGDGAVLAHLAPTQCRQPEESCPWAGDLCLHPRCPVAGRVLPAAGPQQQQHPTREGFLLGGALALPAPLLAAFFRLASGVPIPGGIFILTRVHA